jgi:hypothetical protein
MKKNNILLILLFLLSQVYVSYHTEAQSCMQFPADCPDNESLQQMAEKKWEGPADLKVKEEYAMQDHLRDFFISMMQQMAKSENWQYYLFQEDQESGIGIDGNTKPLSYPLRRPCQWGISFIFIANEDSLKAWQNWYNNDLQNAINNMVNSYKQAANYQSNDEIKKQQESFETYKHNKTIAYRNESIIRVTCNINEYTTASLSENAKIVKQLPEPGVSLSVLVHNNQPDEHEIFGQYLRSSDYALLLFGRWVLTLNEYNAYNAMYRADKKSNDAVTIKKIPSDKVQTITIHVEGASKYINQFLQSLDMQKLTGLIYN